MPGTECFGENKGVTLIPVPKLAKKSLIYELLSMQPSWKTRHDTLSSTSLMRSALKSPPLLLARCQLWCLT